MSLVACLLAGFAGPRGAASFVQRGARPTKGMIHTVRFFREQQIDTEREEEEREKRREEDDDDDVGVGLEAFYFFLPFVALFLSWGFVGVRPLSSRFSARSREV